MAVKVFCDQCSGKDAFRVRLYVESSQAGNKAIQPPKFDVDLCPTCFANFANIVNAALTPRSAVGTQ